MEECDHLIGYEEGCYEAWVRTKSEGFLNEEEESGDIRFNFCPLCGDKLE